MTKIKLKINRKAKLNKDNDDDIDDDEIKNCIKSLKNIFDKNNQLDDLEKTLDKEEEDDNQDLSGAKQINHLNNQIKFYKKRLQRKDELIELSPRYNTYS